MTISHVLCLCAALAASLHFVVASAPRQEEERVKRSDDPAPLEVVVDKLSQQVNTLTAQVAALTDRQSKSERAVAFHAWNNARTINTTPQGTIILTHVQTNIGNAYDSHTGFFTAPVSGLYFFHATFMDSSVQDQVHAGIYVDDTMVASSTSDARHGYWDNPGIAAIVHVTAGQRAQLRSNDDVSDQFYGRQYTTFSGVLIRSD